ncbi:MAG: hypothetical protein RHS_0273 [Robinsoniella sp. RHS]|uniref:DUF262 domain-containing protein n=1 Tax=Robinsoniella sp. RHS TaxID=1504536 RepID=UPI00064AB8B8|nr:MAG: hypothetical protein RHS_0273 [Robinsoniella sp. RHS]
MKVELLLNILDTDQEDIDIILVGEKQEDKIIWNKTDDYPVGPEYSLEIITDSEVKNIMGIKKGKNIIENVQEIKQQFIECLFALDITRQEDEIDGFEHIHNSDEIINELDNDPYDPKLIRVDPKNFPIEQIVGMIKDGDMDISPDFQRELVWNDITRKSRLIESLLLRIPLPMFYVSQDKEGIFSVVDGIQRLNVINSFINNEFRLKNLEYLKDCEGKWYMAEGKPPSDSLQPIYIRRIKQTQLYFNVIDPQTPEKVKFDIFKRINTGGKSLNAQEIRNCLASKKTREYIKRMAQSEEFLRATKGSISSTRMADKEIVLRFIAFYLLDNGLLNRKEYRGGMDAFLDDTLDYLNSVKNVQILNDIETNFTNAMYNAYLLFGERAFRKTNFINKSLFLAMSRTLYKYDSNKISEQHIEQKIENALKEEIDNNTKFSNALSMATNDARNVDITFSTIKKLLERYLL